MEEDLRVRCFGGSAGGKLLLDADEDDSAEPGECSGDGILK